MEIIYNCTTEPSSCVKSHIWDCTNTAGDVTNGNVVQPTSSSGVVTRQYSYDAFGNSLAALDLADANPFRYCGEYTDEETGLIYLRARYYDSSTGRFVSEDPVKDGLNWYAFCSNNPAMFVDPSGLSDVPKDGTKSLNYIIEQSMGIINCKLEYMSGDRRWSHSSAEYHRNQLNKEIDNIREFSPAMAEIIQTVILSNKGDIQAISSVIALCVEMRDDISDGDFKAGMEVIPENSIYDKYDYYVRTGNLYFSGDQEGTAKEKILPDVRYSVPMQYIFTGNSKLLGYWIRVIYYDIEKQGGISDAFNTDTEDMPNFGEIQKAH